MAFNACKKEVNNTSNTSANYHAFANEEDPEEIAYDNVIDAASYGLLDLKNDAAFKEMINEQVQLQFDGDDNVLLLKLDSLMSQAGRNLQEEMIASLNAHGHSELADYITPAIHGLDYNSTKIYSQVFIPFIEDKNLDGQITVICPNKNDDSVLLGFSASADGAVDILDINEDYAISHLLWVISMNESVDHRGGLQSHSDQANGSSQGKPTAVGDRFLEINQINIHEKKEGWGNGRADISHVTFIFRSGCTINDNTQGLPFCKLANADLNTWWTPTYNGGGLRVLSNLLGQYDAQWEQQYSEYLYTLIYEKDIRTKFNHDYTFGSCSGNKAHYCSKETPYGEIHPVFSDYTSPASNPNYKNYSPSQDGDFKLKGFKL